MSEQCGTASGTRIALGDHGDRQRPIDRKVRVVVRDTQVLDGIMWAIDPIAHVGGRGQRLEAVQEAGRHVQVPKVVVVEQECLLLAEGRRIPADIDQNVAHGAVGAADQLRLAAPRASVHAADNSLGRTGLGVLHERRGDSLLADVVVENVRVEGSGEQSAVVAERLRDEDENVCEVRFFDAHRIMLP